MGYSQMDLISLISSDALLKQRNYDIAFGGYENEIPRFMQINLTFRWCGRAGNIVPRPIAVWARRPARR